VWGLKFLVPDYFWPKFLLLWGQVPSWRAHRRAPGRPGLVRALGGPLAGRRAGFCFSWLSVSPSGLRGQAMAFWGLGRGGWILLSRTFSFMQLNIEYQASCPS
jgi:hypothetical protein